MNIGLFKRGGNSCCWLLSSRSVFRAYALRWRLRLRLGRHVRNEYWDEGSWADRR